MNDENYEVSILKIPDDTGYWLVRADGGRYYEDFFLNNFISISDNEITMDMIADCTKESFAGLTIEHYKNLYSDTYEKWNSQQIAHAASRTQKFIDEMKIGDLILVPSKKSAAFLIGTISSEVYEISPEELQSVSEVNYGINPSFKRRKVQWLKEVTRQEISEKLYWILSAHQTIFNLNNQKEHINQLLAPVYIQDDTCHGTIKISRSEGLNSNDWYDLYSLIKEKSDCSQGEVIIKSNVQSPGLIEFVTNNATTVLTVTTLLSGFLFGEVNFVGIKFKGVLPYFQSYKKEKLEMKKIQKELGMMDEDKKAKEIENERSQFELEKDREIWKMEKLEKEAERLRLRLQISSFDAGTVFEGQTQTDCEDNQNADIS
ncbi:hypothetical protein [Peribacillus asahii]|uniref:hypothetical protein n=1 Tax=Peribacillus asahii TaxID=228899 RepID=UPI003805494F